MPTADILETSEYNATGEEQIGNIEPDALEDAKQVMRRVTVEDDTNRVNSATNLVNTFNFAVQVQANRAKWQPSDYRAFAVALIALDSIGRPLAEVSETLDAYQQHVPVNQS